MMLFLSEILSAMLLRHASGDNCCKPFSGVLLGDASRLGSFLSEAWTRAGGTQDLHFGASLRHQLVSLH